VRAVPRLCKFYPGICLITEEKARKTLSQGKKNLSEVNKNLSQCTVFSVSVQYTQSVCSMQVSVQYTSQCTVYIDYVDVQIIKLCLEI